MPGHRELLASVQDVRRRLADAGPTHVRADGDVERVSLPGPECDALRDVLVAEQARVVIEIGLAYGSSALAIAEALLRRGGGEATHLVIDPYQQRFEDAGRAAIAAAGLDDRVVLLTERSQLALPRLVTEGFVADAAFVDGGHRFHHVFVDLCFLGELVRPGGLIVLDDVQWPAVATAARYFEVNMGWRVEGIGSSTRLRGFRVPEPREEPTFEHFRPFPLDADPSDGDPSDGDLSDGDPSNADPSNADPSDGGPRNAIAVDPEVARRRSFDSLPGPPDLPGADWVVDEERSWPTGSLDPDRPKSRRAQGSGCVAAWRSLSQAPTARSAWVEMVPYATVADAQESLGQTPQFFVGRHGPGHHITDGRVVDGVTVSGVAAPWTYQQTISGPDTTAVEHYVGTTVGRVMCLCCCSGPPASWSWADVALLASTLAQRVRAGRTDVGP